MFNRVTCLHAAGVLASACILTFSGSFAGAAVTSTDLRSNPEGQDRADLAVPTNLWRSEFLRRTDNEEADDRTQGADDQQQGPAVPRSTETRRDNNVSANVIDVASEIFDDGTASLLDDFENQSGTLQDTETPLTDWENAVCNATGSSSKQGGQTGPTAVTVVVGCVGAIVVFGAYFRTSG